MIAFALATIIGASLGLLAWALRDLLRARWDRDVGWLRGVVWRFTPEPFDGRVHVAMYYIVVLALSAGIILSQHRLLFAVALITLIITPRLVLDMAWERRRKAIDEQLPAAVRQISSGVASGLTLALAIERLAERAPAPIRTEFRVMANYWKRGADLTSVIEEARRRMQLANFNLFASAILVTQRMGGNMIPTLDRLAAALESADRMRRDVYAATSEGRTNVKVLAIAPLIMLGLVELMDHQAVGMLFAKPLGQGLLATAVLLTAIGALWARSIVHADV